MKVSWTKVHLFGPQRSRKSVTGYYVRVWCEEDSKLEWILFTLSSVTSVKDALEVINIYKQRWAIELS